MAVAQWRQMRQMPHFWNGKYNLWKQIKSLFFFSSKFVYIHPLCLTLFRPGLRPCTINQVEHFSSTKLWWVVLFSTNNNGIYLPPNVKHLLIINDYEFLYVAGISSGMFTWVYFDIYKIVCLHQKDKNLETKRIWKTAVWLGSSALLHKSSFGT